jgi:hypothetical protein
VFLIVKKNMQFDCDGAAVAAKYKSVEDDRSRKRAKLVIGGN